MTTTRVGTAIAAAILAVIVAAIVPGTPAFADPPAKPAADPKAEKKTDKAPAPAPDKKQPLSDADAKRFVDFFDKLVAIVVANQDDCVKMAAGINGHIDANQAVVKELNDPKNKDKELPAAVKDRVQKKVRDELTPAITKKCSTDKSVEAAFNRMGAGREK